MSYFVYIIGYFDKPTPCKVGISANPEARMAQLQTANPNPLALLWTIECETKEEAAAKERSVHAQFAARRLSGEWIDATSDEIVKADWSAVAAPKRKTSTAFTFGGTEPFFPVIPADLINVKKRDMSFTDRCRHWEAFDLPAPPEGFNDWYIVGNAKSGVLGALPVEGFMDEVDGPA